MKGGHTAARVWPEVVWAIIRYTIYIVGGVGLLVLTALVAVFLVWLWLQAIIITAPASLLLLAFVFFGKHQDVPDVRESLNEWR